MTIRSLKVALSSILGSTLESLNGYLLSLSELSTIRNSQEVFYYVFLALHGLFTLFPIRKLMTSLVLIMISIPPFSNERVTINGSLKFEICVTNSPDSNACRIITHCDHPSMFHFISSI